MTTVPNPADNSAEAALAALDRRLTADVHRLATIALLPETKQTHAYAAFAADTIQAAR